MLQFDSSTVAQIAGASLSLLFRYTPVLKDKFDKLAFTEKQIVMAIVLLVTSVAMALWICSGLVPDAVLICEGQGRIQWQAVFSVYLKALIANQAVYMVTRQKRREEAEPVEETESSMS